MWPHTALTHRLGLDFPLVQGPFGGGLSSVDLTVAVSAAGGLGSFGAHILSPDEIVSTARAIRQRTSRAFNLNLWVPLPGENDSPFSDAAYAQEAARHAARFARHGLSVPPRPDRFAAQSFREQLDALIEAAPPVASFVFGLPPANALAALRARGTYCIGAATTVLEAQALEAHGFDAIVASGADAGGHRPSFLRPAEESLIGTFSLVPQIVDAVRLPVIAAGGLADGRGVAAALCLGASGAQIGTAFLACDESNAPAGHKRELTGPRARDTALTRGFTGRLARGIRNRALAELEAGGEPPPYPIRAWMTAPVTRAAAAADTVEDLPLWSGQAAALARRERASDSFRRLVEETAAVLRRRDEQGRPGK